VGIQQSILLCLFITIINFGCTSNKKKEMQFQACTNDWFLQIEKEILTGDGQGHGPDIGSLEWRSVIEFKLGIRNDPKVPPLESTQWCNYINEHFITEHHQREKR
jgi:hypothetical protein